MSRQFSLINANGETYDLTVRPTAFLHSVGGLGAAFETEYQRIGGHFSLLSYYAAQSVTISSDTVNDSPCKITIYGYAENPTWSHYLNNQLIATGKVNATIAADRKLVIDTTVIPYQIRLYDLQGNFIQDLYQQSDFSTERFFNLGFGQNVISVSSESVGTVKIGVEGMIEYETV